MSEQARKAPESVNPFETPCAVCDRKFGIVDSFTVNDEGELVHVRCYGVAV